MVPEMVRDIWCKTRDEHYHWLGQMRERELRSRGYMRRDEIPYPADGNYTEFDSYRGITTARTARVDDKLIFSQHFSDRLPQRLWFASPQGSKFFWDNIGNGGQIRIEHPNRKEERAVIWAGGECDQPDVFKRYQDAARPVEYMLKTMSVVFLGRPEYGSWAQRNGFIQVEVWPKIAESHLFARGEVEWPQGRPVPSFAAMRRRGYRPIAVPATT